MYLQHRHKCYLLSIWSCLGKPKRLQYSLPQYFHPVLLSSAKPRPSSASLALSLAVALGEGYTNVYLTVQLLCVPTGSHTKGGWRDIWKARQKLEGMTYLTPGTWESRAAKRGMWTGNPLLLWCPSVGHQARTVSGSCCWSAGVGILPCCVSPWQSKSVLTTTICLKILLSNLADG